MIGRVTSMTVTTFLGRPDVPSGPGAPEWKGPVMFGIRGSRARAVWRALGGARVDLAPSRGRRVAVVGLVGLLAAAIVWSGSPASAATSTGVAYGGETSQHQQAFFLLSSTRRTIKDVVQVNAELGTVHVKPDGSSAKTARSTEEGDRPSWSDYWVEQISGRVSSDRITGSFHGHLTTRRSDGSLVDDCDSLYVTFKAIQ
jgi:hypothetical protein